MIIRFCAAAMVLAPACGIHGAWAQQYPDRPIRIIVPFPAGGGADLWARLIAQKVSDAWGQNVVVDNRAGASGIIGTELAAKAAGDGHTLLLGTTGSHATNPVVFRQLPYDAIRDFARCQSPRAAKMRAPS